MAYTLKDLDNDIQAGVGLFVYGLDVYEEADIADENLFRAVYERRRVEWVAQERRSTENYLRKLGPVAPEDEEAVIARERADAAKLRGDGLAGFFIAPRAPLRFDEAAARRRFAAVYRKRLASLPETFPAPLLPAVADVRLLALRAVSPRVMALIKSYEAECKVRREREGAAHHARYLKLIAEHPKFKHFSYHDWRIVSFRREGRDMVMRLETRDKLTFKNATMLRRDGPLRGWMWHSEEVRPFGGGFEVEILAWGRDTRLVILRCDDVEMEKAPPEPPGYSIPGHEDCRL